MAFARAPGYNNLPNGAFSPVIYSKKIIKAFRKASVVDDITNTDFAGEITNFGDTVAIIREPDVTVAAYVRGQQLTSQMLDDDSISMVVDKANQFQFAVDDIEKKHSHVNFQELATSRAAYKLVDTYDSDILTYIDGQVASAMMYGSKATSAGLVDLGFDTGEVSPLDAMNRLKRFMDEANMPQDNRWIVADPYFWELMGDEDSKLLNHDWTNSGENLLRNGKVTDGQIRGFKCYMSINVPTGTVQGATYRVLLAGHKSAVCTANQIAKTESFRSQNSFSDVVRGLHLYGRKAIRAADGLAACYFKID